MKKIAVLGLRLVALLLLMVSSYIAMHLLTPIELPGAVGAIFVVLPPIAVAVASMYAIRREFNVEQFGPVGKPLFYSLCLVVSLLLAAVGVFIAFAVIVELFGE